LTQTQETGSSKAKIIKEQKSSKLIMYCFMNNLLSNMTEINPIFEYTETNSTIEFQYEINQSSSQ